MYKGLVIRCYGRQENIPQFVNSDSFMADKNYVKWLSDLKKRFHIAQLSCCQSEYGNAQILPQLVEEFATRLVDLFKKT